MASSNDPSSSEHMSVPESNETSPRASASSLPPQVHRTLSQSSLLSSHHSPHPTGFTPARQSPVLIRHASVGSHAHAQRKRSASATSSRATARGKVAHSGTLSEEDDEDGDGGNDQGPSRTALHQTDSDEEDHPFSDREDDPITLKDRQSLINVEHPFGLPIWKPALYKKSRSVTRRADAALHSTPSAQAERHLLPGNIFWFLVFGWWLALACFMVSALLCCVPAGGRRYASLLFGLGWYVAWPFGKYVEGDERAASSLPKDEETNARDSDDFPENSIPHLSHSDSDDTVDAPTLKAIPRLQHSTTDFFPQHEQSDSWNPTRISSETTALLPTPNIHSSPSRSYGATMLPQLASKSSDSFTQNTSDWFGKACFWLLFLSVIAPLMLVACIACWALVVTVPMAKLNWALLKYMFQQPTSLRFCAAPPAVVVPSPRVDPASASTEATPTLPRFSFKHPRLAAGQAAPSGSPTSTVLLCTYEAAGWQYYKYTVGGVNILFVNLLPIVFFVIFDGFFLLPVVERRKRTGSEIPPLLGIVASRGLIFFLSLASVIPLSYFIGMAVASISAQSSIGMGAVINATFGSAIEILLYAIALTQGKGHLVEGSIVGSLLAGVLLMPGMSMCSGALRKKEQKFNAKSAGVTSMMLIMAIIGTLTPTLFYQTYGNFQLICSGCPKHPSNTPGDLPWTCDHCYYKHPDPVDDPFYQSTVKELMFFCAAVLLLSYLIGLWFSLRTHASQIWQNPQQLLHPIEFAVPPGQSRTSIYQRLVPAGMAHLTNSGRRPQSLHRKQSSAINVGNEMLPGSQIPVPRNSDHTAAGTLPQKPMAPPLSPSITRRVSYAPSSVPQTSHQVMIPQMTENLEYPVKPDNLQHLPDMITADEFTHAVAVATVSALRHQQRQSQSPARIRALGGSFVGDAGGQSHDAPSWSRTVSASVLLACTALYALIAELLIHVVDVLLEDAGIDEKFLGVTLFALVPNTTEFMNAMSFALNGNIALSMEIGSAYALQVCLLQIPAMVAFSAWYAPDKMGQVADTFTLIFPRWDVVVIILSVFLMTYTYIEAKSNYHRGSILVLSYLVLAAGFYYAPKTDIDLDDIGFFTKFLMSLRLL